MTERPSPDDGLVASLRQRLAGAPDADRLKPIGINRIFIGPDSLGRLADEVSDLATGGLVTILEDATPMRRGDADLKSEVERRLRALGDVRRIVLGPADGRLHADAEALSTARSAIEGAACVVSVGSGTLTDVAKEACNVHDGTPLVAIQTAVSVNGFSDDMAVILKGGVKRTVPSSWVTTLLVDTDTIRGAPHAMNQSGVGELLAMFTAPADWHLAALLGFDDSYSPAVVDLYRRDGERLFEIAGGVGDLDGAALDELARLMTRSGVALGVAGRTAPLSGMEHTISHMLDMSAVHRGQPVGLHGAQVGVAAIVSAVLWECVLDRPEVLLRQAQAHAAEEMEDRVRGAFAELDPSGAMGDECWSDYAAKLSTWRRCQPSIPRLLDGWEEVERSLRQVLATPEEMARALHAAGAPARFSELDPPVDADRARWAVANCHLMRNRFTVADLAFFGGAWSDDDVENVLERASSVGGGL